MPIATPDVYAEMLDAAKKGAFAYPAINVSSSQTLNAALQGFAEAGSDGIVQVSTGGGEYASGPTIKNMVTGAVALAAYAHEVAKNYPVNIALHTDHCPKNKLDGFVRPLLAHLHRAGQERRAAAVPVAHVGRLRGAGGGEPVHRRRAAGADLGREHHPGDRGRRGRRRGGRRQPRDQREALHHRRRRAADRRGARHRREGPLHHRADLRQRARGLQARRGQAAARGAEGHPGAGRRQDRQGAARSTWSSTAAPARRWRRSGRRWTTAWSR